MWYWYGIAHSAEPTTSTVSLPHCTTWPVGALMHCDQTLSAALWPAGRLTLVRCPQRCGPPVTVLCGSALLWHSESCGLAARRGKGQHTDALCAHCAAIVQCGDSSHSVRRSTAALLRVPSQCVVLTYATVACAESSGPARDGTALTVLPTGSFTVYRTVGCAAHAAKPAPPRRAGAR